MNKIYTDFDESMDRNCNHMFMIATSQVRKSETLSNYYYMFTNIFFYKLIRIKNIFLHF